jgi:hypothetical protein
MSLKSKLLFWVFLCAAAQPALLVGSPQSDVAVTYFSGPSGGIGSRDGRGTDSRFNGSAGIWADGQNVYIADAGNYTIRKISTATSQVTTDTWRHFLANCRVFKSACIFQGNTAGDKQCAGHHDRTSNPLQRTR